MRLRLNKKSLVTLTNTQSNRSEAQNIEQQQIYHKVPSNKHKEKKAAQNLEHIKKLYKVANTSSSKNLDTRTLYQDSPNVRNRKYKVI